MVVPSYGRLGGPADVRRTVVAAERLGYEGAWFADHVALPGYAVGFLPPPLLEPLAACAWGLGVTERLRFGVDVLVGPYRHPLVTAATAATAARLSGGRLVLGVGVGYLVGEFAALGLDPADRGVRTDETLAVLRRLWEGPAPVERDGVRFPLRDVHPVCTPGEPGAVGALPLWVGGNAPVAWRRAAALGDGWHPLWPTPEEYAAGRAHVVAARAAAGEERPFTFSYSGPLMRVLDAPRDWAAEPPPAPPPPGSVRPELGYAPPVPRAAGGRPLLTGTPDEVAADVARLAAAGVEHLLLRFWTTASDLDTDGVVRQMERFAASVAPNVP